MSSIKNGARITIHLFGQEQEVEVLCTGDNQFDEMGNYKEGEFPLTEEEAACLSWFVQNVRIEEYRAAIAAYCNEQYEAIGEEGITESDIENEISIDTIAVNISTITQSKSRFVYPEISFLGECVCDPEHGICIGFRDKQFLGIHAQDWTL